MRTRIRDNISFYSQSQLNAALLHYKRLNRATILHPRSNSAQSHITKLAPSQLYHKHHSSRPIRWAEYEVLTRPNRALHWTAVLWFTLKTLHSRLVLSRLSFWISYSIANHLHAPLIRAKRFNPLQQRQSFDDCIINTFFHISIFQPLFYLSSPSNFLLNSSFICTVLKGLCCVRPFCSYEHHITQPQVTECPLNFLVKFSRQKTSWCEEVATYFVW